MSIFGQQLATQTVSNYDPPFPTEQNGTKVLMGGLALPMRYLANGQINAQVPFGVAINTQQQLIVMQGNSVSVPVSMVVAPGAARDIYAAG